MSKFEFSEVNSPEHFCRVMLGTKHLYTLQHRESYMICAKGIIVTHNERPPKLIDFEGKEHPLDLAQLGVDLSDADH